MRKLIILINISILYIDVHLLFSVNSPLHRLIILPFYYFTLQPVLRSSLDWLDSTVNQRNRAKWIKHLAILAGRKFRPDGVQTSTQTVLPRRIQFQWHDLTAGTCGFRLLRIAVTRIAGFVLFLPLQLDRLQDFNRRRATRWIQQTREHLSQGERDTLYIMFRKTIGHRNPTFHVPLCYTPYWHHIPRDMLWRWSVVTHKLDYD